MLLPMWLDLIFQGSWGSRLFPWWSSLLSWWPQLISGGRSALENKRRAFVFSLTKATWPVHLLQRPSSPRPGWSRCFKIEILLLLVLSWEELFNRHLLNLIQVRTPSWRPWLLSPTRWWSSPWPCQPGWSRPQPSRSSPSRLLDPRTVLGSKRKGITVLLSIT